MAVISIVERLKTVSVCKEPEMIPICTVNTAVLSLKESKNPIAAFTGFHSATKFWGEGGNMTSE